MSDTSKISSQLKALVSIEDVVKALASQCDGARKRDGRGFNRADAQEGGRLAALKSKGMPWSRDDAQKAIEITSKYAKQAGLILGDGRDSKAAGIENSLRSGRVQLSDEVTDNQEAYNYACLSPGGKRVYFWRLAWIDDLGALVSALRLSATSNPHGQRKNRLDTKVEAEMTINGTRRKCVRSEIDFNGSTQAAILDVCARFGFLAEPALSAPVDSEIDDLRRSPRACWIQRGTRNGEKGVWAVFDLDTKHPEFSEAVKHRLRGRFQCDKLDDWNWFIDWRPETIQIVRRLAWEFKFVVSSEVKQGLV